MALRLHAIADLEVLGKRHSFIGTHTTETHRQAWATLESSCKFASSKECTGDGAKNVPSRAWCLGRLDSRKARRLT